MAVSDFLLDQPCFMHVIWCNLSQILFRENLMANKQHSQTYIPCHRTLSFPSALPASLRLRFSGLQGTLNCQLRSVWSPGYYSSVSEIGHSACLDTSWCKLVAKEGVSSWFLFVFFFPRPPSVTESGTISACPSCFHPLGQADGKAISLATTFR